MLTYPRPGLKALTTIVLAALTITLLVCASGAARLAQAAGNTPRAVAGQALVKMRPGAPRPVGADGAPFLVVPSGAWYVVRASSAAQAKADNADALAVEPNVIVTVDDAQPASNDPLFGQQYSLTNMAVPAAWPVADGSAATVYVLDTGAALSHPDLAVTPGPDYVDNDNTPADLHGHGTHVAGIVGAVRDNGIGVAGVSRAKVVAVRVLGANGSGAFDGIARGMRWAADQPDARKIVSMSLGAAGQYQVMADAAAYLRARNTLLVAAAGNASTDAPASPAIYADLGVIAVGRDNRIAGFSNFGPNGNIAAPGVDVLSTMLTSGGSLTNTSGYGTLSGTSMAAPNVAGVAALAWSAHKDYSATQIAALLRSTASTPPGDNYHYGSGIVNAARAVTGGSAPSPTATPGRPAPTATPGPATKWSQELFTLLNEQRAANGLAALPWSDALANAAHAHNVAMNTCAARQGIDGCFSHQLPGEADPITRMRNAGWPGGGMEDIGYGYPSPADMVAGWMQSPGHRAAILATNATAFGPDFLDGSGTGAWQGFFWTLDVGTGYTPTQPAPTPHPTAPAALEPWRVTITLDYGVTLPDVMTLVNLCKLVHWSCAWTPPRTPWPNGAQP